VFDGSWKAIATNLDPVTDSSLRAGFKYRVIVSRSGPGSMRLTLGGVTVDAVVRSLNDGGLLIQVRLM